MSWSKEAREILLDLWTDGRLTGKEGVTADKYDVIDYALTRLTAITREAVDTITDIKLDNEDHMLSTCKNAQDFLRAVQRERAKETFNESSKS